MDEIDFYLKEDLDDEGDITSDSVFTDEEGEAQIVAHEQCIVAGLEEAQEVFRRLGVNMERQKEDGKEVEEEEVVATVSGRMRSILTGERLALNFICRMSGIATETRRLVGICSIVNPRVKIAATRKTTPGFRKFEKKAVEIGGGESHRLGLYDAVLIKDNHVAGVGSINEAIQRVKRKVKGKIIEVEAQSEEEALQAAHLNVDVIMLDNLPPSEAKETTRKVKQINPHILIEVSGGITAENILEYASFADRISLGYITHSVKAKDFSLEIIENR
ncbi:MAG TPA: carboxylating nicotinate-nucleotide diphosphorylase [Thermoplasmata archaeon]|nr:carboxylating nicotinate-nucleotide diphosphorylase [Thermoplasmata archaeon]